MNKRRRKKERNKAAVLIARMLPETERFRATQPKFEDTVEFYRAYANLVGLLKEKSGE